ncbi:MAG TPA: serine/threonine-protein kinase [Gemmatimonadales bacterium]|jgi:serine/threonine-protein kinase|nr:serine/threonine-protein kinase [Gemmatimonadales bacterium]
MTHAPTDLVGRSVGPYQLERLLGQGGFAWVFVGREPDGTPVAVKLLKPRYAGDPQFETRFRNEAETAAKLEHPNIIHIRAVARTGDHVYFGMDLCADSLSTRLQREGPLPEVDLVRIASDVARGLMFAHAQGVIHRDLKPDNILIHSNGRAVISDFGIARAVSGYVASTGVNMTIGTPQYLSPEQAQGRPLDLRVDLYALGITLFKAATGEAPFSSPDWFELARMHVEDPPPGLRKKRPELSKRFERVVFRCLAKHADDRYPNAAALLADLNEVAVRQRATREIALAPLGTRPRRALLSPGGTTPWRLIAVVGLGLALLVALVVRLMR